MVAARDSKSRPARGGGSSPLPGTNFVCIIGVNGFTFRNQVAYT